MEIMPPACGGKNIKQPYGKQSLLLLNKYTANTEIMPEMLISEQDTESWGV